MVGERLSKKRRGGWRKRRGSDGRVGGDVVKGGGERDYADP